MLNLVVVLFEKSLDQFYMRIPALRSTNKIASAVAVAATLHNTKKRN